MYEVGKVVQSVRGWVWGYELAEQPSSNAPPAVAEAPHSHRGGRRRSQRLLLRARSTRGASRAESCLVSGCLVSSLGSCLALAQLQVNFAAEPAAAAAVAGEVLALVCGSRREGVEGPVLGLVTRSTAEARAGCPGPGPSRRRA